MSLAIKSSRSRFSGGAFGGLSRIAGSGRIPAPTLSPNRIGSIGDPGIFGDIFNVFKGATQLIPGPIGDIAERLFKPISLPPAGPGGAGFPTSGGFFPNLPLQERPGTQMVPSPGLIPAVQRFFPGGQTGTEVGGCTTGFHLNKSDYFLKDGTFIRKGSVCVKNRRKNPLNPRALSSAIQRVESAKKKEQVLKRITIRCKPHGKASCPSCR